MAQKILSATQLFAISPVIPVIVLNRVEDAVPLAEAIVKGGIYVMEITLRTSAALEGIARLRQHSDAYRIGAGTVINIEQFEQCVHAGAQFAISPGLTPALLKNADTSSVSLIPGASTISELMEGLAQGYTHFKFFPAELVGGPAMLKAIYGLLPHVRFCPTGGINAKNFLEYLALPNVDCVGGSWIVPEILIKEKNWQKITDLCRKAQVSVRGTCLSQ